ncbi:MAG: di-trans,poly-cis-decaprenylcistransferase [Candidatus Schekmanbacteria bacterium RIFCSPHIGHO2_02_FULL_38_11]|uniref:Isoprenyl transferase n=1 Tax=Candidatus Schekmanbacteria bacterium RIFCSPLOWO2_12_FULL_38_15 TaxID=1817883 RepID=A0A1F7SH57_9BACT|nr:MAG: di-trans,poly-cis-decaprenylcistransferase [Candidatus Schekmanbacteria bacterium GWA2_38_9]OGL48598.1 MAG: di-trans,poly-cis-decaprenylcistransferase [Candidatus Schekmanbacteria bacterium RIFCSPLOWO2_02_FULL_38_14]OGL50144.1 MAG: di-trans,poly-cis-decaprenylcistransferase [Candidatus Schekmanbacteria bacterium RIFCSPHIGHO2_02_FULL_38_11]OGL52578.1 MAG: di-trans,poly-cis-decaprenylcistransferase [Candidatus Schekmanbacteria bacterium RIFCSPLOWO2_12_FULL_38_15]
MREEELLKKIDPKKLPRHIAIIMDGNGRWARMRKLNRIEGHRRATETVRNVVMTCRELNIEILTLYTFSQENWNRPKTEISALMILLKKFLRDELEEMMGNNIRLISIGRTERLPVDVKRTLDFVTGQTKNNDGMILNLALSYGSRTEIIDTVKKIANKVKEKTLGIDEINDEIFSKNLYTSDLPDPDLMIRTSGEMRISNFLLWQLAYAELWITPVLWPDFNKVHLFEAILDYQSRERRFGLTAEQLKEKKRVMLF